MFQNHYTSFNPHHTYIRHRHSKIKRCTLTPLAPILAIVWGYFIIEMINILLLLLLLSLIDLENYGKHKKAHIYWNTSFGRLKFQFLNMEGKGNGRLYYY
ncbi:unnamed protein product [Rhizophagus irregularis]|nr:unnamed protein product [Rhizophagus irregularis]CAB4442742.1 unnamed protein product [Rhizophagus irregularis]